MRSFEVTEVKVQKTDQTKLGTVCCKEGQKSGVFMAPTENELRIIKEVFAKSHGTKDYERPYMQY